MWTQINLFIAWVMIPQTLAMGWVAAAGRFLLELGGLVTHEEDIPGRIIGIILLISAVYVVRHFNQGKLPPDGNPQGSGYQFGFRLVFIGNVLATLLFIFPFCYQLIENRDVIMILSKFAIAFGYIAMAFWAVGFSFIYQSSLTQTAKLDSK